MAHNEPSYLDLWCFVVFGTCTDKGEWTCPSLAIERVNLGILVVTVKFLNFRTPEFFAVRYLKFKQGGQTLCYFVKMVQRE